MRSPPPAGAMGAAGLLVLLTACAGGGPPDGAGNGPPSPGTVRVFAAASLTAAFTEVAQAFEAQSPAVGVEFNFAASSTLARQIADGAPADVVTTADEASMRPLIDGGHVSDPLVLARNRLTILVEKGNPERISGLPDLARDDLVVVLCAPEVPCGRLTAAALDRTGVVVRPASLEENVTAVTAKVTLGEADAGVAYVTDARTERDRVDSVPIDVATAPGLEAVYPIAIVGGGNAEVARAWVDFALSPAGQTILAGFGFLPP